MSALDNMPTKYQQAAPIKGKYQDVNSYQSFKRHPKLPPRNTEVTVTFSDPEACPVIPHQHLLLWLHPHKCLKSGRRFTENDLRCTL